MCDKIDEDKKKWIIGGSILGVIIIVIIIVVVVLTVDGDDDNDNKNKGSNIGDGNNNNDTNTTIMDDIINDRTNVLFIIIDDLGWGDIPAHGGLFSMDNLDSLFEEGIEFTNYYVHPVCTPTRASFLTGKYAWKLGLQDVQTMAPGVDQRIPLNTPTVSEVFTSDELDYTTYYVGKWHIGYAKWAYTPVGRGFDYGFGILQSHGNYYNHTNSLGDYPALTGYDMFDLTSRQPYWPGDGIYSADLYIEKAKEYIYQHKIGQDKQDKPFYMYLSWQTIHEPMQDPNTTYEECEGLSEYEEVTVYCNKLKYFDVLLGRLIKFLKDNDLYDNTLIAITTDNGGMPQYETTFKSDFFFHSSYGCNYPYRGGKITLFEGGVKGVGLMAGNIIKEMGLDNTKSNILLHAVDWYNTLLGIAGVEDVTDFIAQNMPEFDDTRSFDGVNIFDYITEDINGNTMNRSYIYPNIEKENPLVNTTNETLSDLVNKLMDGGIMLDLPMNQTYEEYLMSLNDLKSSLDTVLWWDQDSLTMWKYIRGTHLYWNSYHCNQTYYNYDDLLYIYNAEWLFNLTDNPREYEELNYLNPLFDFSSVNNNINEEMVNNITLHLRDMIDYQVSDNGYRQGQEGTQWYCKSIPQCNNGTWAPFLHDNGSYINDNCENFCTVIDYLSEWGVSSEEELLSRYWD